MADARCCCGSLSLSLTAPAKLIAACHCLDCQRRTGSAFGVGAFYPVETVSISGTAKEFLRTGASGGAVRNYFCSNCGSTLYWKAESAPALIGVAVGALADPEQTGPTLSVFERSKRDWANIDGVVEHFHQGVSAKRSD